MAKYNKAVGYYQKKKYGDASDLFEEAKPALRGKKEEIELSFYQAYCFYHQKQREKSADCFHHFYKTFPRDIRVEEALYMQGYNLYLESPYSNLDQRITLEAMSALEKYLEKYPEGRYFSKVTGYWTELNVKLAKKTFDNARIYHDMENYKAAVIALGNFVKEFPKSVLIEEALYLKIDAQHKLMIKGKDLKKEDLIEVIRECNSFIDKYPKSKHIFEIEKIYESVLTFIEKSHSNP